MKGFLHLSNNLIEESAVTRIKTRVPGFKNYWKSKEEKDVRFQERKRKGKHKHSEAIS